MPSSKSVPAWLRPAEVAAELHIPTHAVRRLAESGRLDGFQIGLSGRRQYWRISADSVAAYTAESVA